MPRIPVFQSAPPLLQIKSADIFTIVDQDIVKPNVRRKTGEHRLSDLLAIKALLKRIEWRNLSLLFRQKFTVEYKFLLFDLERGVNHVRKCLTDIIARARIERNL